MYLLDGEKSPKSEIDIHHTNKSVHIFFTPTNQHTAMSHQSA